MSSTGCQKLLFIFWVLVFLGAGSSEASSQEKGPDLRYWRLADVRSQFDAWENDYPEIFHQLVLGQSTQGVAIPMVRISDQAADSEAEPRLFFHGALHANEPNGTTAIMKSIEALLLGYRNDPAVTARVDGLELFFVPILNVDGHNHVFNDGVSWQDWRKNLRDNDGNGQPDFPGDGVDLNRNWDWNWATYAGADSSSLKYKGPYPFSEPEICAVRDFVLEQLPVVVVDYHSPVTIKWRKCIFWPWSDQNTGEMGPDREVAEAVAAIWAAATFDEEGHPYQEIQAYSTLPKEQSWVYGKTGILAYIMEIADHCWWQGAVVDTIGIRVARGSETLMDRVLQGPGIRGVITAQTTGEPLVAKVIIHEMHAEQVGPRLSESQFGEYYRLTMGGVFTVTVSCAGYESQTQEVTVGQGWQRLDFSLVPEGR